MKTQNNIVNNLPKYMFWDLDVSKLNIQKDFDVIIARVLMFSDFSNYKENILFLESLYNEDTIKKTIISSSSTISDEVCKLTSERYQISIQSKFNSNVSF